jgi:hypothetical protein
MTKPKDPDNPKRFQPWLRSEIKFIMDNYRYMRNEEIAKELGRTIYSVKCAAFRLGLSRATGVKTA